MQSKTLSSKGRLFNATLFRKNLGRFWPLWAMYAAVWLLAGPVNQFLTLFGYSARYVQSPAQLADRAATALLSSGTEFGLWMAFFSACVFAMALFSYLYTARSVGMMHSFPIRRENLFFANYLTGLAVFLATLAVCGLLTAAVQAAAGVLVWKNVGLWFFCAAGQMLFFYSFAVFCAMFTGQVLAVPVFYAAWNGVAYVFCLAVQSLGNLFLYGYRGGGTPGWVRWLTPVYRLGSRLQSTSEWNEALECSVNHTVEGLGTLGIYALAGVAFAVGALAVYKVRRSETAGDTVSVSWARQLFRFGVGLCAALTLGQWLYQLIWNQFFYAETGLHVLPLAVLCMILLGLVGFYGAEMLLCKSFRVFRTGWKGAVLTAVILVALGAGIGLDVTGVETRVPDAASVQSLDFSINGSSSVSGVVRDPETIQKFLDLHQSLIAGKDEELRREDHYRFNEEDPAGGTWASAWISLDYNLGNTTLRRSYQADYLYAELEEPDSLIAQVAALICDPAVQRAGLLGYYSDIEEQESMETMIASLASGEMEYVRAIYGEDQGYDTATYPFEESIAREVLSALLRDIDAGRAGRTMLAKDGWEQAYENDISFRYRDQMGNYRYLVRIFISPAYTETVAALKARGIVSEERRLLTRGELVRMMEAGESVSNLDAAEGYAGQVTQEDPQAGEQALTLTNHNAAVN